MIISWVVYLVVAAFVIAIVGSALRVLREYERGVMFTLGRFTGVKGPGLILILPYISRWCASICE
jgi:regulator of protease activity HflC (stomatin/prohibitin superfamily)